MAQIRIWDFGSPFSAERGREVNRALNEPGCYAGYDISVINADTIELSANGYLLMPSGLLVSETSAIRLRKSPLPGFATNYTITCRHIDDPVIGGSQAVYAIEDGLFDVGSLVNGVVIGWIIYPGGGVALDQTFITKAPCGPASGSIDPAAGDLSGTWPNITVIGLQGTPLGAPFSPSSGDVLTYNGSGWVPASPGLSVASDAIVSSEGQWTVPAGTAIGNLVRVSGNFTGDFADNGSALTGSSVGMIIAKPTPTTATLVYGGRISGLIGLSVGSSYYLSTVGTMTSTPLDPNLISNSGRVHLFLGQAISGNDLLLRIGEPAVL